MYGALEGADGSRSRLTSASEVPADGWTRDCASSLGIKQHVRSSMNMVTRLLSPNMKCAGQRLRAQRGFVCAQEVCAQMIPVDKVVNTATCSFLAACVASKHCTTRRTDTQVMQTYSGYTKRP